VKKTSRRHRKGYDGTAVTTRRFGDLLPAFLSTIQIKQVERHDLILTTWQQIVDPTIARFTNPESFAEGILKVKVNNSTLYSLLTQSEKNKLLSLLRKKFPKVEIKDIFFRMG
jgi:Dna[CI] antecedent, DciA